VTWHIAFDVCAIVYAAFAATVARTWRTRALRAEARADALVDAIQQRVVMRVEGRQ
jgi:hypothetical protein